MGVQKQDRIVKRFQEQVRQHARYSLAKEWESLSTRDLVMAISLATRDFAVDRLLATEERYSNANAKRVYYLSMEFLMGQSLRNNLVCLELIEPCRKAMADLGVDLETILDSECDAALGNGGLGRLAACYLDSMASLQMPGYGYGINYEFGLFRQSIDNGFQKEKPDQWMVQGNPWQIERLDEACLVPFYGRMAHEHDRKGNYNPVWMDWQVIVGVPHDMPIVGYGGHSVNYLRLYSARASDEFDMQDFNDGDYMSAVEHKISSETISKVLYPSDSVAQGRELRLVQEYFFTACAIRDIIRRFQRDNSDFSRLPEHAAIQLNDTHPTLGVAELMRILVDENDVPWDNAWDITQKTLAYTNHTLLPEALEKWPVHLVEKVVPRHLQIIYEINRRFLEQVTLTWPEDSEKLRSLSIIEEGDQKSVRMANLGIVGSHAVNGVSALHSDLVKSHLVPNFYELWPEKFHNVTNGVTQRRFMLASNPGLSDLITKTIGDEWICQLDKLVDLEDSADDREFQKAFRQIKRANKERLANVIAKTTRISVDPDSMFDIQAKRIHEYKRQLLNVLHIIHLYFRIKEDGWTPDTPRTFVFAGKAAPGYWVAKQFIKLINSVAAVVNKDPQVNEWIRVAFVPDYRVSLAEKILPAADLSEQISIAGMEASGTGNMKFALNGALTIGTLDGANVEMREDVGDENIFIFGLLTEEVNRMRADGTYDPWYYYNENPHLRRVMDSLRSDLFSPGNPTFFEWVFHRVLTDGDYYFLMADFQAYADAQEEVGTLYPQAAQWDKKAILNVARMGKFSSDRSISDYARDIWGIESCPEKKSARAKQKA